MFQLISAILRCCPDQASELRRLDFLAPEAQVLPAFDWLMAWTISSSHFEVRWLQWLQWQWLPGAVRCCRECLVMMPSSMLCPHLAQELRNYMGCLRLRSFWGALLFSTANSGIWIHCVLPIKLDRSQALNVLPYHAVVLFYLYFLWFANVWSCQMS